MYDEHHDPSLAAEADGALDLSVVARDDMLLTALGSGEPTPHGDELAAMLAAWRADLRLDDATTPAESVPSPQPLPSSQPPPSPHPLPEPTPLRRRGWSRQARGLVAAAAAVVLLAGGATLAAGGARPGSPLWPITTIVYGERADSLIAEQDAEQAIQQARDAIADARYTEAVRFLDVATARAGDVRDGTVAHRLLAEIAAVRGLLPGGIGTLPSATSSPSPPSTAPGQPQPTPAPTSTTSSGGVPLPLPLPTLPTSLPSLPLPPLPLPTITLPPLLP